MADIRRVREDKIESFRRSAVCSVKSPAHDVKTGSSPKVAGGLRKNGIKLDPRGRFDLVRRKSLKERGVKRAGADGGVKETDRLPVQQRVRVSGNAERQLRRRGELPPFVPLLRGFQAVEARLLLPAAFLDLVCGNGIHGRLNSQLGGPRVPTNRLFGTYSVLRCLRSRILSRIRGAASSKDFPDLMELQTKQQVRRFSFE